MSKPVDLFNLPMPNIGRIAADGLEHARDRLGLLFVRFFTPEAIARDGWISRERYADFIRWLRIVEDMVRRIVFIEASAIATSLPPPAPPCVRVARPRKPGPEFDSRNVDTWRPRFAMTPRPPRSAAASRAPRRKPREAIWTWPLALRMQALLEVAHDPHACIQRLARRLRNSGLSRFLHLSAPKTYFHGRADPTIRALSAACAERFDNSS
jgi:hypothetical protein